MKLSKNLSIIGSLLLRLIGYWEVLILFGIQLFWIIYRGEVLHHENTLEVLTIISPIMIAIIIGALTRYERIRVMIKTLEWLFHFLTAALGLVLVFLILSRDELNPLMPFTWSFYIWLFFFGFVLISNISMNLGEKPLLTYFQNKRIVFLIVGWIISWLLMLILIYIMHYPVSYWIFACIFHSIMIPLSFDKRNRDKEIISHPKDLRVRLVIYEMFKESFLIFLMIFAWNQWGFEVHALGSIEDNYYLILGFFLSPLFYLGIILSFLLLYFESKKQIKVSILGDLFGLTIIGLSLINFHTLAPIAFGYALVNLLFHLSSSPSIRYSIAISFIPVGWWISLTLFAFNGMMIDFGEIINLALFLLLLILYVISISSLGIHVLRNFLNNRRGGKS